MQPQSELRKNLSDTFGLPDDLDLRVIAELQSDPRARIAELGRRVGLSPPAVAERLRRLEDSAAVTFRAEVNPRALGYTLSAIVRVSPMSGHVHAIPDIARQTPEITECYRITGEDCYFMRLYLRSIDDSGADPGPLRGARPDHDVDRAFRPGPAPVATGVSRPGLRLTGAGRRRDPLRT